jgi:hypothetical protein
LPVSLQAIVGIEVSRTPGRVLVQPQQPVSFALLCLFFVFFFLLPPSSSLTPLPLPVSTCEI